MQKIDYIKQWEGFRGQPYDDATGKKIKAPVGNVTIAYGINTDSNPLSEEDATLLLVKQIERIERQIRLTYTWYDMLTHNRQIAVLDMVYNMGLPTFQKFRKAIAALALGSWSVAAAEIKDSDYGRKNTSKERCAANCNLILNG